jgi:RNA polymerase sigma-70 factor (ECF subfamily)
LNFIKNISTKVPDETLLFKYQECGDLQILADLYQQYMDVVYGVCLKYLRTPDDAKDAVINIYEELIIKVKKHQVEHFKAWLYQLAKNHCLMILRKKKTFPIEIDSELVQLKDESHLEEAMTKEAHLTIMQECINQLVSQQKIAIELFYFKEKCYKEIAETTKMDVNKVKSFIQNGRRNLKICMDNKIQKSFN